MDSASFLDWIEEPGMVGISLPEDDECILYEGENYSGDSLSFILNDYGEFIHELAGYGWNDRVSSY